MSDFYARQLEALRALSLDRHLRENCSPQGPIIDLGGKRLVNFSSNDYLGLANDPRLRDAATAAITEFGVGAGASRLISGTQSPHGRNLQEKGFFVPAIRYPTVAKSAARLRITISAAHEEQHLRSLAKAIKAAAEKRVN